MRFVRRYSICHSFLFLVLLFHHCHAISRLYDDPHDQSFPPPFPHAPFAFVLSCKLVICDLTCPPSLRATYTSHLLCLKAIPSFSHHPDHMISLVVRLFPTLRISSNTPYSIYNRRYIATGFSLSFVIFRIPLPYSTLCSLGQVSCVLQRSLSGLWFSRPIFHFYFV